MAIAHIFIELARAGTFGQIHLLFGRLVPIKCRCLNNLALAVVAASIVIGVAVVGLLAIEGSTSRTTGICDQGCGIPLSLSSTQTVEAVSQNSTIASDAANATSSQPCNSSIPQDPLQNLAGESESNLSHALDNGSVRSIAFVLRAGAAAMLCITYAVQGNYSPNDFKVQAWAVNSTKLVGGYEYSYTAAPSINFTFDPASVNSTDTSPHNLTVVYNVTSSPDFTGFYTITYPNDCPPFLPLAVTTDSPGSISSADFPGFFIPSSCRLDSPFGSVMITGFSGMSAIWLTA
jgi:hypothetical protein